MSGIKVPLKLFSRTGEMNQIIVRTVRRILAPVKRRL
jgi:hypothetical protein